MKRKLLHLALGAVMCTGMMMSAFAAEYTTSGTVITVDGLDSGESHAVTVWDGDKKVGQGVVDGSSGEIYIVEGTDTSNLTVKNEMTGDEISEKTTPTPTPTPTPTDPDDNPPSDDNDWSRYPENEGYDDDDDAGDDDEEEYTGPSVDYKTGDHGNVMISPTSPQKGDIVTLTVIPDTGYIVGTVTVTSNGKDIMLFGQDDNIYTFTMPGNNIVISTSFRALDSITYAGQLYSDVPPTEWYANAVAFVTSNGMMVGNNGLFAPNDHLTRGMMAQILYNMEKASFAPMASFPDVTVSDWFAPAASWASAQGYMSGYSNGYFGPNDAITREQLAAILYRYAASKGYPANAAADLTGFSDGAATSDWAVPSVRWAVGSGILSGKLGIGGSRLDPTGTATRAEIAQILMNFQTQITK